jgi:hypothetical protein
MKITKRIAQPRIGKDGKYLSLFRKETRSISSLEGEDIEKGMGELYGTGSPSNSEIIESYENYALEILEGAGFHHKKPFNFLDCYVIDGGEYSYFSPDGFKTAKELAEAQNLKPSGLLTGVVDRILNDPDWDMTIPGRAAKILNYCHFLKHSMKQGNIEDTVHNSMLLQQEFDTLNFMAFEECTRIGESRQGSGKAIGEGNRGKERLFTTFVREAMSRFPPDTPVEEIINDLQYSESDRIEFESFDKDDFKYWEDDQRKSITIKKLKQKVSKLKKS